ncbi:unnamed protein product [marine sediment metagenome]|uniref:Phage capsid-like C-terminal domain-containing protein n=1 Tax=marine sediment metagenome TaxID=412755 RepID=X1VXL3_9ZZZZ
MDKVRSLKNAMGDYIYQKPAEGKPGTIWGYPFTEVDGMPDLADSAASTPFIGFCNPRYLLNLNRIGMEVKMFSETIQAVTDDLSYLSARTRQFFAVAVPTACAKLTTNAE